MTTEDENKIRKDCMWTDIDFFEDSHDEDDDDDNDFDSYSEDKGPSMHHMQQIMNMHNHIKHTPFGQVNLDDPTSPLYDTHFCSCHINFNLSKPIFNSIVHLDGVEFLKVISRYRFVVGFGTMFSIEEVQLSIEKAMGVNRQKVMIDVTESNEDVDKILQDIKSNITDSSKWIAYIFPNGEHIVKKSDNTTDILNKYEEFTKLAEESHGLIFTSEDISTK